MPTPFDAVDIREKDGYKKEKPPRRYAPTGMAGITGTGGRIDRNRKRD